MLLTPHAAGSRGAADVAAADADVSLLGLSREGI